MTDNIQFSKYIEEIYLTSILPRKNLLTVVRKFCLPQKEKSSYRVLKNLLTAERKYCLPYQVKTAYLTGKILLDIQNHFILICYHPMQR